MLRRNRFGDLQRRFTELPMRTLEHGASPISRIEGILRVLGPDATLRRGYSITRNERGELIRTVAGSSPENEIENARQRRRIRIGDSVAGIGDPRPRSYLAR